MARGSVSCPSIWSLLLWWIGDPWFPPCLEVARSFLSPGVMSLDLYLDFRSIHSFKVPTWRATSFPEFLNTGVVFVSHRICYPIFFVFRLYLPLFPSASTATCALLSSRYGQVPLWTDIAIKWWLLSRALHTFSNQWSKLSTEVGGNETFSSESMWVLPWIVGGATIGSWTWVAPCRIVDWMTWCVFEWILMHDIPHPFPIVLVSILSA